MTFIIGIIQFHSKIERKQVKLNKTKQNTCRSYKILLYFNDISWWGLSLKQKIPIQEASFSFIQ